MTARAFITGIGGQDGTYLAERLVEEGMEVHALVLEADGHPAHCPDEVVLHAGDLGDLEATRHLLHEVAPQEVYNLAAISSVAQSWDEPDRTAHVNGHAAVALMESARRDWGYAGDYVDAMWRMLQQDEADDYVISTGETHSIREFLDAAFAHVGIDDWSKHVTQDPRFMRPAEVELLIGDASKAKDKLGWTPTVSFAELVAMMVDSDITAVKAGW